MLTKCLRIEFRDYVRLYAAPQQPVKLLADVEADLIAEGVSIRVDSTLVLVPWSNVACVVKDIDAG